MFSFKRKIIIYSNMKIFLIIEKMFLSLKCQKNFLEVVTLTTMCAK